MSIAEIHGKLSPDKPESISDRSEDLLTSSVFGGFRYVGWQAGLIDWLKDSEAVWKPLPNPWAGVINKVAYSFWPWLNQTDCEPDLALLIQFEEHPPLLILIEVKYLSGMSDRDNLAVADENGPTGNQLADQISGLSRMTVHEISEWFNAGTEKKTDNSAQALIVTLADRPLRRVHLLISADAARPEDTYDTARRFLRTDPPISCYWLSWTQLAKHMQRGMKDTNPRTAAFSLDTYRLLDRRGLTLFDGFHLTVWMCEEPGSFWDDFSSGWWKQEPIRFNVSHFWGT